MLIRWVHLATFVAVVSLQAVSCELDNTHTDINLDNIDIFCPCLERTICPRVFGTKPEDSKYLGELMQCADDGLVRCCGASDSYVVGILKIISTTQEPEPEFFSGPNPEDDIANGADDHKREHDDEPTGTTDSEKVQDLIGVDENLMMNEQIERDELIEPEPTETKPLTETSRAEALLSPDLKLLDSEIADNDNLNNFDENLMKKELTDEETDKSESTIETSETEAPISDTESEYGSEISTETEAPITHELKSIDGIEVTPIDSSEVTPIDSSEVTPIDSSEVTPIDSSEVTETPIIHAFKSVGDSEIAAETEAPIIYDYKSIDDSEITTTTETEAPNIDGFNSLDGSDITKIAETEAPINDDFRASDDSEITVTAETEASETSQTETPIYDEFKSLEDNGITETETPINDDFNLLKGSEVTEISETESAINDDFKSLDGNETTEISETESAINDDFKSLDGNETTEISETEAPADLDFKSLEDIVDGNEATTMEPDAFTTESQNEDRTISHRKPKMLNNVIMVYPNEMSGIPKTTPKNMPETNELKMFDEDMGMNLHLVFSKETSEPNIELESTTLTTAERPNIEFGTTTVTEKPNMETTTVHNNDSTTKQLQFGDRKRRRQYRPTKKLTTPSPTKVTRKKSTISNTHTTPTNLSTRLTSFQKRRLTPQESTDSKIRLKSSTTRATTKNPIIQGEEEQEILHTSEDDKTHQSRFKLFKSRNRMNYLRRTTPTTTATTELPIEESTHHVPQSVNLTGKKKGQKKMSETLIHQMDTSHRIMITKVRDGLMAASSEKQIIEIPRSFGSADMDKRVRKVETMLASKMMNAYNQIKSNRTDESITTEQPIEKSTLNTNRPYRGRKKFDLTDPRQYSEIANKEQRRRIRSTTVRPVNVNEDATTTTRSRRRRTTTTTTQPTTNEVIFKRKPTQIVDSTASKDNQKKHFRRRVKIKRRRLSVEPVITTALPPVLATTSTTTRLFSTIIETKPRTTTFKVSEATSTESSEVTGASNASGQSKDEISNTVEIDTESIKRIETDVDAVSFKPSPLWSIQTDEANDFTETEDVNDSSRQSRNIFQPPTQYMNGFVPVSSVDGDFPFIGPISLIDRAFPFIGPIPKPNKFADDHRVPYSLPIDVQVTNFS